MQRVAVGWLAWTLTHSGAWLGIMSMAEFFPVVFLSPLAGALADRRDRVGIIRVTQIAGSIEATLLAVLVYTGAITIELLFALTLLLGVFNAVAQPSRLALIPTLVDRAALPSALAINAIIFNSARFLGPAVAGIVIAQVSVGAAFAVNAVTYIVFLVAMANLRGIPALPVAATQSVLKASAEAYGYASRHPGIAPMLLLFTVTTIGTRGFVELFPGFADSVFGRGPEGLAMLTSTVGLGAIFGGRLDAAAPGDHRADPTRPRQHADHVAGDPRLYRDEPVLPGAALRLRRRRRDDDHRDRRADPDPGRGRHSACAAGSWRSTA